MHHRFRPKAACAAYRVFWLLLDLDEIDALAAQAALFSRNRFNLYRLSRPRLWRRSGRAACAADRDAICAARAGIADGGPDPAADHAAHPRLCLQPAQHLFLLSPRRQPLRHLYEVHNTFGETA
jgi:DUF1365 family protein